MVEARVVKVCTHLCRLHTSSLVKWMTHHPKMGVVIIWSRDVFEFWEISDDSSKTVRNIET